MGACHRTVEQWETNSNSSEGMEKLIALLPDVPCIPMVISC